MKLNHRASEVNHSRRRASERYDVKLSKGDIAEIGKIILSPNRDNKCFLQQDPGGSSHWLVRHNNQIYRLVFDERRQVVRTFLELRPVDEMVWRNTHDRDGHPTIGDVARIKKLKLK